MHLLIFDKMLIVSSTVDLINVQTRFQKSWNTVQIVNKKRNAIIYKSHKLIFLKCHAKYWLILDFMRATHSKKVGTGSNKRPEKLNVHIRNSWRTNLQLIRSIGNMIGYKKRLSEWQCLSEVKMGRGSPIPPKLR